ncbi:hypothetical protein F8M41_010552 [Gigaspora margarita]|uniref:Uncharacterized protein n=1 Tax=Gigaspora margarita TaxID=4874 RepID=A0A8H3X281_GIGMA|nr:hypothetical protein F8M41_010552 [Gigaspora margarita]
MSKKKCKTEKQTNKENMSTTTQKDEQISAQIATIKNVAITLLEAKPHNNTLQEYQEPTWHEKVEQEATVLKDITNIQTDTTNKQVNLDIEQPFQAPLKLTQAMKKLMTWP